MDTILFIIKDITVSVMSVIERVKGYLVSITVCYFALTWSVFSDGQVTLVTFYTPCCERVKLSLDKSFGGHYPGGYFFYFSGRIEPTGNRAE